MRQNLLLIHGSTKVHQRLTTELRAEPIEVHTAAHAGDGLAMARSIRPDVILLDVDLDQENGLQLCQKLKSDPLTQQIPVIFLTPPAVADPAALSRSHGAVGSMPRSFEGVNIKQRLAAILREKPAVMQDVFADRNSGTGGTASRTYFMRRLQAELAYARSSGTLLSCIVLEVHGSDPDVTVLPAIHAAKLVRDISAFLLERSRTHDTVCNFGGGRFAILAPLTSPADAQSMATGFLEAIGNRIWMVGESHVQLHCSAGVADTESISDGTLLRRGLDAARRASSQRKSRNVAA